jgi:lactose/L-arabinose transport system permease protein
MDRSFAALRLAAVYLILSVAAVISVFPFYWMIVSATNTSADVIRGKASFGDQIWVNIAGFFTQVDAGRIFFNSAFVAVVGTVLTLAISSLAGYGFEMFRSRLRERIFAAMLLMLSVPFAAIMVPLFVIMAKFGLINTYAALLLPTISSIFIIFYFRQTTKAFPSELRDAARIDGLKEWQIFLFIYVPVMRSTYAAATIIVFMANWNAYLWPLIVLQDVEVRTLPIILTWYNNRHTADLGLQMAASILIVMPILVIYLFLQRWVVRGFTLSGFK